MCIDVCRQHAVYQCLCKLCSSRALACLFQISRSLFWFVSDRVGSSIPSSYSLRWQRGILESRQRVCRPLSLYNQIVADSCRILVTCIDLCRCFCIIVWSVVNVITLRSVASCTTRFMFHSIWMSNAWILNALNLGSCGAVEWLWLFQRTYLTFW